MPKLSRDSVPPEKLNESGPNYIGYYKHKLLELFSENKSPLAPLCSQESSASRPNVEVSVGEVGTDVRKVGESSSNCSGSGSLFSGGIEGGLSDFMRDRVKAFLKQSVIVMDQEVDEILEEVLVVSRIQSHLKENLPASCSSRVETGDTSKSFSKKQKISSSPLPKSDHRHAMKECFASYAKGNMDLQALLEDKGLLPKEAVQMYSDELSTKLGNMEQQLEEFLDALMSKCRPMTRVEKEQLRQQIEQLPPLALNRVVEIVGRTNLSAKNTCNEINIDLEEEDNVTLWRLYYYVKTVASTNGKP